jgi:hypothetical protein
LLVDQIPVAFRVFLGAPAVISRAEFLAGQRRLLVGVVLAAGENAPEQHGEFAGGRDDRLAMPAARLGARAERVPGPGLQHCAPGGLDERPAGVSGSAFGDPAAARRLIAGLLDLRVKAQIGDQLPADPAADIANSSPQGRSA